jgi:hypothetical protein
MLQCSIVVAQAIVLSGIVDLTTPGRLANRQIPVYDRLHIVRRSCSDKVRRQKKEIKIWIYWPSSAASTFPNCNA